MSFVDDSLRRLDANIDRFQLSEARQRIETAATAISDPGIVPAVDSDPRAVQLKAVVRALSTTSSSHPLLRRSRVRGLLVQIAHQKRGSGYALTEAPTPEVSNLEWIAAGKATIQVYGLILASLLDRTIPLSESIWYWDDVLGSYMNIGLYTAQTSPLRFWKSTKEVYADAKQRFNADVSIRESAREATSNITAGWKEFYALVRNSIAERSLVQAQTRILSPFSLARIEARRNRDEIIKLRRTSAAEIGRLVRECLVFDLPAEERKPGALSVASDARDWKTTISRSITLLDNATQGKNSLPDHFEATPPELAHKLLKILDTYLPEQETDANSKRVAHGKPSRLVRYWIPAVTLLLSGSTLLRVFANRRAEITQWFRELGQTTIDFYTNWVLEPIQRLIGTIRHDEQSEIAIQSRDSLRADKESLERMVVDFAVEHPENGTRYTDEQIGELRAKVREGDLTSVLKAYERQMQSPIKNAIMGDLVRTLLIQVQKTKVDVEVAIGGIDSLLKSQELLFGFVGIAPGVLISYALFQWLRGVLGGRRGLKQGQSKSEAIRLIRNIDRTLNNAVGSTEDKVIGEEDHGLLLCEVYLLRQRATTALPRSVQKEFLEDLDDLMDVQSGVERQRGALRRLQWAYSKWLR